MGTWTKSPVCIPHLTCAPQFVNLDRISGDTILKEYYNKIGGRNKIFDIKERQDSNNATGRRRPRRGTKRLAETVPRVPEKKWCPPEGSWEDEIESIDGLEEGREDFVVFLRWKNGKKTKHGIHIIHKKCPQMVSNLSPTKPARILYYWHKLDASVLQTTYPACWSRPGNASEQLERWTIINGLRNKILTPRPIIRDFLIYKIPEVFLVTYLCFHSLYSSLR